MPATTSWPSLDALWQLKERNPGFDGTVKKPPIVGCR